MTPANSNMSKGQSNTPAPIIDHCTQIGTLPMLLFLFEVLASTSAGGTEGAAHPHPLRLLSTTRLNVSPKFGDTGRGIIAQLARVAQNHLGPLAKVTNEPGRANALSRQCHLGTAKLCPIGSIDHCGKRRGWIWLTRVNKGEKCRVGPGIGCVIRRGDHATDLSGVANLAHGIPWGNGYCACRERAQA